MAKPPVEWRCPGTGRADYPPNNVRCTDVEGHDGPCHWNFHDDLTWGRGGVRVKEQA